MRLISSKEIWYEEECVEYNNEEEYKEDLNKRKQDRWMQMKYLILRMERWSYFKRKPVKGFVNFIEDIIECRSEIENNEK